MDSRLVEGIYQPAVRCPFPDLTSRQGSEHGVHRAPSIVWDGAARNGCDFCYMHVFLLLQHHYGRPGGFLGPAFRLAQMISPTRLTPCRAQQ